MKKILNRIRQPFFVLGFFTLWGVITAIISGFYWLCIKFNSGDLGGGIWLASSAIAMYWGWTLEILSKQKFESAERYKEYVELSRDHDRLEDEIKSLKSKIKHEAEYELVGEPTPVGQIDFLHRVSLLESDNQSLRLKIQELTDKLFLKNPDVSSEYERLRAEIFDLSLKRKNEVEELNEEIVELKEELKILSRRYGKDKTDPTL